MSESVFWVYVEAFHFLRIWVFAAAVPVLWIWWQMRSRQGAQASETDWIAPHLVQALTVPGTSRKGVQPIDVIALVMLLLIAAAAGPSWTRAPAPFAAQTAPLVIALQVSPSMEATDVAPDRLERAKQKARDLLELRAGARTALVAFGGSAHVVVPMSEDPGVMQPYLEGLRPDVMPIEGQDVGAGFDVARTLLAREAAAGGVVFLLDDLSAADATALETAWRDGGAAEGAGEDEEAAIAQASVASMSFLYLLPDGSALPAGPEGSFSQAVTADGRDVAAIERSLASAYQRAQLSDAAQPWEDRGAWLAWPAALLLLIWFRRGMAVRWAAQLAVALWFVLPATEAQAEGWRDWFLTADQQGWRAYQRKDYETAAARFEDPYLRGVALYRGGQYETAAQEMARIDTADAAFIEGMSQLKSRGYRDGVRAFERALAIDPNHAGAQQNLPIAKDIVTYVETTRAQSDTGEESGIGADDTVFDNESGQGAETQIEASEEEAAGGHLSAEQWMRTVDTRTEDFLRQRFRLEAVQPTGD
ncbi:VWA domain-containing protein [Shimia sp. MMG029]|uniref:VWA domain-containing protein n=1 Tax=Shimia sp. MMG029 TaxID=3021978 RepID=UPI0022FE35E8|nr:VWA domain-containing protein [Shimia sp. MMG029]MDA5558445.1 VWA domain-containing protein [Shimia sp. MMG029]